MTGRSDQCRLLPSCPSLLASENMVAGSFLLLFSPDVFAVSFPKVLDTTLTPPMKASSFVRSFSSPGSDE